MSKVTTPTTRDSLTPGTSSKQEAMASSLTSSGKSAASVSSALGQFAAVYVYVCVCARMFVAICLCACR